MKKEINYWKYVTFILATIFLMIVFVEVKTINEMKEYGKENIVSIDGVQIPERDLKDLIELHKGEDSFSICDITNKNCIKITKIK